MLAVLQIFNHCDGHQITCLCARSAMKAISGVAWSAMVGAESTSVGSIILFVTAANTLVPFGGL